MKDRVFYSTCFLLIFAFGVLKVLWFPAQPSSFFENQVGEKVEFSGLVLDDPEHKETNQKLVVQVKEDGYEAKILVTVPLGEGFKYGDTVTISGKLEKPENFVTDTGKEFDYIHYLAKEGIYYLLSYPDIEIVSVGGGNKVKSFLFQIKNKFLEKINYAILGNENLLMGGLILGEKAAFSSELRQEFVDTGTIHIIALSGYNVTIVAEWLMKAFTFLGRNLSFGFGILGIMLFVLMTGASSTAIRAGIMAILVLVARATGRTYDVGRALVLAATVMILVNPMVLLYDVSFQLSFIATVAVIYLSPRIEKYFTWVTKRFGLRDVVSVTFAAYVFVLPFILYKMGNLSVVALPANFLVLPFIPFTMGLGFITGFVGLFFPFLSLFVGFVSTLFLCYELGVIHFFSSLPFASFVVPSFPLVLTNLIYAYFMYKLFGRNFLKLFSSEN